MPLLYGLHDRQAAPHVPNDGWCVDTIALSENPAPFDYDPRINWIIRANWGYGSTGTIPLPNQFDEYAAACASYVARSANAKIVIIGNEINHEQERPNGVYITPAQYVRCFVLARDATKRANPATQVIPAPCAPYHANPVNWLDYWREMLELIAANGGCDGLALHTYTRSSDPKDITSGATMGPPLEDQYSGFRVFEDALDVVPSAFLSLPVYITEFNELLDGGWHDANTGVVQTAYEYINFWNNQEVDDFPVMCLVLYRWPKFDKWHIEGKQGVIEDFRQAVGKGYTSPMAKNMTQTHLPVISPGTSAPQPSLPQRIWDERLTQRGVTIETPSLAPGQLFWRIVKARWYDEAESQGRHHIYVEALEADGKPTEMDFTVTWPGNAAHGETNGRSGFDAGNFPMSPSRNEFSVSIKPGMGIPVEVLKGIGMGAETPSGFNAGIHTSTGVVFQLVTMPDEETGDGPTPPPSGASVPPLTHPIQDPAKRIISQRFGENPQNYAQFGLQGHNGLDFAVPTGTPIVAVDDGTVVEVLEDLDGYGKYVKLRHAWGESLYAHLNDFSQSIGRHTTQRGAVVGISGSTGNSTGPHLHFAIRINPYQRGAPFDGYSDPLPYLAKDSAPVPPVGLTTKGTIYAAAIVHDFDYHLLASMAWAESSWRANAQSDAGAMGILQIMPATWAEWASRVDPPATDPFNDAQNLEVGIAYMKWLLGQTNGNVWKALVAYNFGIGNVLSGAPIPDESAEFANKVLHGRDLLKAVGA